MTDLSQIPDADLFREASTRPAARAWAAHILQLGRDRRKPTPCPACGAVLPSATEYRSHKLHCKEEK
jgi:hypothetical protein